MPFFAQNRRWVSAKGGWVWGEIRRASKFQMFKWITFYDALPQTLIGMRVAISFALIVAILCEMFMGSPLGIGQRITEAWTTYRIPELYALIMLAGIFGFCLNRIFVYFENKLVPWVGKA